MKKTDIQFEAISIAVKKVCAHFKVTPNINILHSRDNYLQKNICTNESVWEAVGNELELLLASGITVFCHPTRSVLYGFEIKKYSTMGLLHDTFKPAPLGGLKIIGKICLKSYFNNKEKEAE